MDTQDRLKIVITRDGTADLDIAVLQRPAAKTDRDKNGKCFTAHDTAFTLNSIQGIIQCDTGP